MVRAPNTDLARDPRWGRSEESFGEDPFLTGTMATAFAKGLQGDDPKYWLTASLMKHFLANSNEDGRDGSSSNFDERLLREYYSMPFRMGVIEGGSRGYMASYNAYNGIPMAVHPILRSMTMHEWGLDGIIRITGQKHFAADVFVGSALGWYFGREVYRKHHDPELGGPGWEVSSNAGDEPRAPANMGSPSVPLDSWVYPAIERLAALGYVRTAYLGIRPWTRMECARLLEEAGERIGDGNTENNEVNPLYSALVGEFADESARWNGASNLGASVDSVYTRFTGISGTPLRDSYHFGQSIINDYGRPYGEGFNPLQGFTSHAVAGPLSITVQGEYQHAPAVLSDAPSVLQATAAADGTLPLPNGTAQIDRFRLLESTIALTFNNVQFSFGQQSLWLGPSESGPFLFSNNAEPMTMLRIESVSPYSVPVLSRLLGPVRSQFFLGRLSGQRWEESPTLFGPNLTSQPFVHGTSVSFHPTSNLEFGFGYTAQFGGQGNPFTWSNFLRTFYSHRANSVTNPAKRLSEFHFSYRLPGLRDWLQVYVDSMVIDEYSPIMLPSDGKRI